jgi:hypothetical protein
VVRENLKMAAQEAKATETQTGSTTRERSKIGFPYGDLDYAVEVATALGQHGGLGEMDRLAAWMDHKTVESGTFKVKLYTARSFGLIQVKGDRITLTDLGNRIIRPADEAQARAQAFLNVPLYRAIYDKYRGRLLPGDAVIEADMGELGVASKQKARARQGFQRSAEQAKLGKDRLVLPAGVSLDLTSPSGGAGRKMETPQTAPTGELDPMLATLLEALPPSGSEWSRDAREQWLRILHRALDRLYKDKAE